MKKTLPILLGIVILGVAVLGSRTGGKSPSPPASPSTEVAGSANQTPPPVTVLTVRPTRATPEISSYGEVRSRFRTLVAAEIAGALVTVAPDAHSGHHVTRGTVLMQLDDSRPRAALAQARADLEQARLHQVEEELRAQQAIADWQRLEASGPPSEFLLRTPQRTSAQLDVQAAEAALLEAERNLDRATITAPFDAVVIQRIASLGSYVQPGTELIELSSSELLELRLPLQGADWALLPPEPELSRQGWPVELVSGADSTHRWQGRVRRVEKHVLAESRQRFLVVAISNPLEQHPPLYPGTFVRATLPGVELDHVLDLPASAVTEKKEIWFVDRDGLLAKRAVDPLVATGGRVLVPAPRGLESLDVLIHPMISYLPGLAVESERIDATEL